MNSILEKYWPPEPNESDNFKFSPLLSPPLSSQKSKRTEIDLLRVVNKWTNMYKNIPKIHDSYLFPRGRVKSPHFGFPAITFSIMKISKKFSNKFWRTLKNKSFLFHNFFSMLSCKVAVAPNLKGHETMVESTFRLSRYNFLNNEDIKKMFKRKL